jgi:hypothetical protein
VDTHQGGLDFISKFTSHTRLPALVPSGLGSGIDVITGRGVRVPISEFGVSRGDTGPHSRVEGALKKGHTTKIW